MHWLSHPITISFVVCVLIQTLAWYRQKQTSNADTVDIAWTLGIMICAVIYLFFVPSNVLNTVMVLMFPLLWYGRLFYHLVIRYDVKHEDSRYQNLRSHWNTHTQWYFFMFFMFQASLSVIFSLTSYWVLTGPPITNLQAIIAGMVGLLALTGVSVADYQLLQFKRAHDNSQVCDIGLWKYSRHPNYFFEWLHWFVYPILLWQSAYFWAAVFMVLLMLLFLLKLTGIPFSEQQALQKRGQAYRDYMHKTSPFILRRPRHD